jgi:hypothetical protein
MGAFFQNPRKATAYFDRTGKHLIVHPARIPDENRHIFPLSSASTTAQNSPRTCLLASPDAATEIGEVTPQSVTNPRDIMFGGIFGMAPDVNNLLRGQVIGPPEAFFPFVNFSADGQPIDDDEDMTEYDDDDTVDDDVDIGAYLALPDAEDDKDFIDMSTFIGDSDGTAQFSDGIDTSPLNRSRSMTESMLDRFDRNPSVVTSFRSNQVKYRDIAGRHSHPDMRASDDHPVRSGKSAETPITPMRKRGSISKRRASFVDSPSLTRSVAESAMTPTRSGPRLGTFA